MKRSILGFAAFMALVAPATAAATTQSASSGDVTATFSFTGRYPNYKHETLTIERSGNVTYSRPVVSAACGEECAPGASSGDASSVQVLDLERDGSPDVVLDLYSGGAHCCSIEQVFSYDQSTGTYVKTERNFGDPGDEIRVLDGRYLFFSADDTFAYAFTDYAASGLPLQILSFSGGRFHNVTRTYPSLVAADAKRWLAAFNSMAPHYSDSVGVAAAWAADEELLGKSSLVHRFLTREAREGHLNSALSPEEPGGERFVRALYKLLRSDGYVHSSAAAADALAAVLPCSMSDFTARLIPGSPGAGQRYAELVLTNVGRYSCHTYGHVGLQLLGSHGRVDATDAVWDFDPAPHRVVLAPGASATAQLHWSVIPGGTADQHGPCVTAPRQIEITPPDTYSHLIVTWAGGTVCEQGRIDVTSLVHGKPMGGKEMCDLAVRRRRGTQPGPQRSLSELKPLAVLR